MDLATDYGKENYLLKAATMRNRNRVLANMVNSFVEPTIIPFAARPKFKLTPAVVQPKILLYSHDTFGLGNIRRTLLLAENLIKEYPRASILIITGSPVIHAFRLPEGIDYIKLPSLDRVNAEKYEPLLLADCAEEIRTTRAAILEKIISGFAPDLFIVDKRPAGIDGELLNALQFLKEKHLRTKVVLGLRDILDEPQRTKKTLRENGSFDVIEKFYDEIWIYGAQEVFDTAKEYGFPPSVIEKTHYCGYLKRPVMRTVGGNGALRVLVTTGGGGDGSQMIETYLESLCLLKAELAVHSTVIFGPQIANAKREMLLKRFNETADISFLDFVPDLTQYYAEADIVVSMAGYNTVCELLSHNKRAVLVPRAEPVREQLIRARLLAQQGFFEIIEPAELDPETMKCKIINAFKTTSIKKHFLDLDGLPRINERVHDLLGKNGSVL